MQGFTVVEFIAAIVLMAVLGVSVSSRFFSPSAFDASALQSDILAVARLAQRVAVARPDADVSLTLSSVDDNWQLIVQADQAGTVAQVHGASLNVDSAITAAAGFAAAAVTASNALVLEYDSLGNVTNVALGATIGSSASGVALSIGGSSNHALCISPVGFAHAGNCL